MGRQQISTMPVAADALALAGANVRIARTNRGWTAAELAARTGVSARTISQIEHGSPTVSAGNLFNVMATLRIPLFTPSRDELARMTTDARRIVALLPSRVVPKEDEPDVNF